MTRANVARSEHRIDVESSSVSAVLLRPRAAHALYVMAHGAGAGMGHVFMETMAQRLGAHGVATLRYQFPFMEAQKKRPDSPRLLEATVRAAVSKGRKLARGLPLVAGGKSMGGRMTSRAASQAQLTGVVGLVFLGFPLHPPGSESDARADHLAGVTLPMLFVQGTRDELARLDRIASVMSRLGSRATLHVVEGANHAFSVPKRSGLTSAEVIDRIAARVAAFAAALPLARNLA